MEKETTIILTDYSFLRLLSAYFIAKEYKNIIDKKILERKLNIFYDNLKFYPLFENICKRISKDANNYVDLTNAFQTATTFGLLIKIDTTSNTQFLINLSLEEAQKVIADYPEEVRYVVFQLVENLQEEEKNTYHPSNDSESIATYLDKFHYNLDKTEEVLAKYRNLNLLRKQKPDKKS